MSVRMSPESGGAIAAALLLPLAIVFIGRLVFFGGVSRISTSLARTRGHHPPLRTRRRRGPWMRLCCAWLRVPATALRGAHGHFIYIV